MCLSARILDRSGWKYIDLNTFWSILRSLIFMWSIHSDTSHTKTKTIYSVDELVLDCVGKVLPLHMYLSASILASCRSRRYRFIRRYLKVRGLCLGLCFVNKKSQQWPVYNTRAFLYAFSFVNQLVRNFQKMKKSTNSSGKNVFYRMAETAQPFSLWVIDNFGKVYVSIEDLVVRRMYVNPDRLRFTFGKPILIF